MTGESTRPSTTFNFRDLGSLPAAGRRTRDGVLFRSDALHLLDEEGRAVLRRLRVATVVDLRDDRETVIGDYALTEANLAGAWLDGAEALLTKPGVPLTEDVLALTAGSPAEVMRETLEYLDEEFGGSEGYLSAHGLLSAEISELRVALLTPPGESL